MPELRLQPNNPVTLALADPSGPLPDDLVVHFPLVDGRTLTLPWKAAVALNRLDLQTGEILSICRDVKEERGFPGLRTAYGSPLKPSRSAPPRKPNRQLWLPVRPMFAYQSQTTA